MLQSLKKINERMLKHIEIILLIVLSLLPSFGFSQDIEEEKTDNIGLVLINPAHGGRDTGLTINEKIKEKNITLGLSRKILEIAGDESPFAIKMTRNSDIGRSEEERIELVNNLKPFAFVSLHIGSSFDPLVRGMKIYVWANTMGAISSGKVESGGKWWEKAGNNLLKDYKIRLLEEAQIDFLSQSKELAEEIRNEIIKIRGIPCTIETAPVKELSTIGAPAVSIEILQASNESDRKMIVDEDMMTQIAEALFNGIQNFVKSQITIEK